MRRPPHKAVYLTVIAIVTAATALPIAYSQMTGSGRAAARSRPLPPGLKTPSLTIDDVGPQAGLDGVNVSGSTRQQMYIVENTGTGAAIVDFDNDGLPDVFLVNGDQFERDQTPNVHYLYRNLGGLKFEDATAKSGITHTDWGQGVCAGDVDNDGKVDLFITAWGENHLWRNQGGGTFRDETRERGLAAGKRWSTGCAFLDYDRDGHLDLFVAHYLAFDPAKTPRPIDPGHCTWKGLPVVCGPMGLPRERMSLYHNDGHGHFTDVSASSGVGRPQSVGLTVLTGDFDNDGWPDIYVACDSAPSLFFLNKHDGTFEEAGVSTALAYDEEGHEQSGMGATAADYDHNGFLDIAKTNFADDMPNLYMNHDGGIFTDVTIKAGLGVHTDLVSWGVGFLDVDNDGWKDLLIVNGHVYPDIDARHVGQTFRQPRLLYWNRRDGQFFDMSANAGPGIEARHSSRGMATGDLDNDGRPEVVVVNMHERPSLLKISGENANAILVRALTSTGRDAIGARLTATAGGMAQIDEVRSGGLYISQPDFRVHFGLASAATVDLAVRWPDGRSDTFRSIAANRLITVQQGRGIVSSVALKR